MSTNIENSVVSMSFENSNFERNAKTTMSTLDKLRKALDFSGSAQTLNDISDAAGKVDMSPLQNGVQEVHNRFSALEIVAITVLSRITNAAIDAGVRVGRALTIDSIMGGFSEYELMMNSVQTIMSGTGESLDTVMDKLNELNQYADDTIYVFSDMTKNIGKFTNAGVDLNTSVAAMKGLSNEAALAGANAEEASRAMYNIAQALSMGYVQYIDWKSIENANMATLDFKENLVETALEMGTLTEAAVQAEPSINSLFKDKLKDGWLTNDVLLTTLEKYADDTTELGKKAYAAAQDIKTFSQMWDTLKEAAGSGWSQTFGYIIGDFEQAKELWTGIGNYFGDAIQKSAEARNSLLEAWNTNEGGRAKVIQGFIELFHALQKTIGNVGLAFQDVFKGPNIVNLLELSDGFLQMATNLNNSLAPVAKDIRHTFDGLFAVLHIGVNIVTSIGRAFAYLVGNSGIGGLGASVLGVTGNIGEFLKGLDEAITKNDTFYNILKNVADALLLIPNGLSAVFQALTGMGFAEAITKAGDGLGNFLGFLKELGSMISGNLSSKIDGLKMSFRGLGTETGLLEIIFKGVADGLSSVASVILDIMTAIGNALTTTFGQADTRNMMDFLNTAGLAGTLGAFLVQVKNLMDPLEDMGSMITNIREDLEILQNSIKADIILKIAEAVALLAVSCILLASIDADKLAAPMAAITLFVGELSGVLVVLDKFTSSSDTFFGSINGIMNAIGQSTQATALIKMSAAVLIMASALKVLSSIQPDRLVSSMTAITVLLGELVGAAILLDKFGGKIHTAGFVSMGLGLLVISGALKVIASIEPDRLTTAVFGFTIAIAEMTAALSVLSQMRVSGLLVAGASLLAVSGAMLVLSGALKVLATIDINSLEVALGAMLGSLLLVTTSLTALSFMNPVGLIAGAAALTVASGAIAVLSGSLLLLSSMSGSGLNTTLVALGSSLAMLSASLLVMRTALPGAAALIVAAGAIAILAPSLALLSAIPFGTMMTTLLGLAIAIGGLAAASVLLSPVLPLMAALAGILTLFGAACLAVGGGVALLATGLAMLAVSGVAGATALVGILSVLLGAIPMIVQAITLFVQTLLQSYMNLLPMILQAVTMTVLGICQTLITCLPTIVETAMQLVLALLTSIRDHLPEILAVGTEIIVELMNGIAEALPQLIDSAFTVIISFIDGLGQAIENNAEAIRNAMIGFCEHLWNAFCNFFGIHSPSTLMAEGGVNIIQGLINGIGGMINAVKQKVKEVRDAIVNKISEKVSDFVTKGKNMMNKLKSGISSKLSDLKTKVSDIVTGMKTTMENKKEEFLTIGSNFMTGLKDGIDSMKDAVVSKASEIGSSLLGKFQSLFDIHSPSRVMFAIGEFIDEGLINGIDSMKRNVTNSATNIAKAVIDSVSDSTSDIDEYVDDEFNFEPVIRPVLDLSEIQNRASSIASLLNDSYYDKASLIDKADEIRRENTIVENTIISQNNKNIINAINGLKQDLIAATDKIASMQMVLDGKTLVGELAPAMDVALGTNSVRAGRGI